ncbi:hypothetical protein SAMN05421780_10357 [Flexibacter flexilis DSM 6793]|uniref:Outer membrane protein beta-barrel domain-containing protein n=1 Tax=Flexibacter flexilis DSM 6793 TaxID=927664 RepID=A0A1I1GR21_9BACT|nr:hypothetical protein [Flexibacter flexilis]SFC13941.1 hypothetical protein SAMN05421780_10357 [Flexibacter flexilis DSM 6793]
MSTKYLFIFLIIISLNTANAQVNRVFVYNGKEISFLAQNNRISNSFTFHGMSVFIIVAAQGTNLNDVYLNDSLRLQKVRGIKDYTCFYYISDTVINNVNFTRFWSNFIDYNYQRDNFNRNNISLIWQSDKDIACDTIGRVANMFINISIYKSDHKITECDYSFIRPYISARHTWQARNYINPLRAYEAASMVSVMNEKLHTREIDSFPCRRQIFIDFTIGYQHINKGVRSQFDEETLVDFAKIRMLWQLETGYFMSSRLGAMAHFGFIYSGKKKEINRIGRDSTTGKLAISGSGYAGAMLRYGLGLRGVVYSQKELNLYADIEAGRTYAVAGGGQADITLGGGGNQTKNITTKKQRGYYYGGAITAAYAVSPLVRLIGNTQYYLSPLPTEMGSVRAFTGFSINVGLAFNFSIFQKRP